MKSKKIVQTKESIPQIHLELNREMENLIAALRELPEELEPDTPFEQKRRMRGKTKTIASLLPQILSTWKLDKPRIEEVIMANWSQIIGEANAHRARPEIVKSGILYIYTGNPVLANELRMNARNILARLHQFPDGKTVKSIRFV